MGRAVRRAFSRGRFPRGFAVAAISIVGIGVLSFGILDLVRYLESAYPSSNLTQLIAQIGVGFGLILGAGALQQVLEVGRPARAQRRADERLTTAGKRPYPSSGTTAATRCKWASGTSSPVFSRRVDRTASRPGVTSAALRASVARSSQ